MNIRQLKKLLEGLDDNTMLAVAKPGGGAALVTSAMGAHFDGTVPPELRRQAEAAKKGVSSYAPEVVLLSFYSPGVPETKLFHVEEEDEKFIEDVNKQSIDRLSGIVFTQALRMEVHSVKLDVQMKPIRILACTAPDKPRGMWDGQCLYRDARERLGVSALAEIVDQVNLRLKDANQAKKEEGL